jgi:hypothetical protein
MNIADEIDGVWIEPKNVTLDGKTVAVAVIHGCVWDDVGRLQLAQAKQDGETATT